MTTIHLNIKNNLVKIGEIDTDWYNLLEDQVLLKNYFINQIVKKENEEKIIKIIMEIFIDFYKKNKLDNILEFNKLDKYEKYNILLDLSLNMTKKFLIRLPTSSITFYWNSKNINYNSTFRKLSWLLLKNKEDLNQLIFINIINDWEEYTEFNQIENKIKEFFQELLVIK